MNTLLRRALVRSRRTVSPFSSLSFSGIRRQSSHDLRNKQFLFHSFSTEESRLNVENRAVPNTEHEAPANASKQITKDEIEAFREFAQKSFDYPAVCQKYLRLIPAQVEWDTSDIYKILNAFTSRASPTRNRNYMHVACLDLCEVLLEKPVTTYGRVLITKALRHYKRKEDLLKLYERVHETYGYSDKTLEDLLEALVFCGDDQAALNTYNIYRDYVHTSHASLRSPGGGGNSAEGDFQSGTMTQPNTSSIHAVSPTGEFTLLKHFVYLELAKLLCLKNSHVRAGQILKDFETDYAVREQQVLQKQSEDESKHESSIMSNLSGNMSRSPSTEGRSSVSSDISVAVCIGKNQRRTKELLGIALMKYDAGVLELVVRWFHEQREVVHLDRGLIDKIFEVACALGRHDILTMAADLMIAQKKPLSPSHHTHLVIGACRVGDLLSALEHLIAAEALGVDFITGTTISDKPSSSSVSEELSSSSSLLVCPEYIQESLAKVLRRPSDVDQAYYAMLDLKNNGTRPPILALNALIIAAGAHNRLDRSFATIQEFEPVFNTKPNALTYNALMGSVVRSRNPRTEVMLTILQEMDDSGFTPDGESFSLLIEGMLLTKNTDHINDMLEHVVTENLPLKMRCLRRLALYYTRKGDDAMAQQVCDLMSKFSGRKILPPFFRIRLTNVKNEVKSRNGGSDLVSSSDRYSTTGEEGGEGIGDTTTVAEDRDSSDEHGAPTSYERD